MKQQNQNQKPSKQKPPVKQSQSPNLLKTTAENTFIEKYYVEISRGAVGLVVLIQILFIGLLIYNSKTVSDIESTQNDIRGLGIILYSKRETEDQIKNVIKRTAKLKQLQSSRTYIKDKVTTVVTGLPQRVSLKSVKLTKVGMKITVETPTPLGVSLLISNYFKNKLASEIIINSATLGRNTEKFTTTLEVVFQ